MFFLKHAIFFCLQRLAFRAKFCRVFRGREMRESEKNSLVLRVFSSHKLLIMRDFRLSYCNHTKRASVQGGILYLILDVKVFF